MAEVLSMNETPADQPSLNSDEQDSLAVAESLEGEQQQLLAGKFENPKALEQAYLELQSKLGASRNEPETSEEGEQEEAPEEVLENQEEQEESSKEVLSEQQAEQLFKMVGGKQAYKTMVNWAGESLSKEEVKMYDSVMADGNPNSIFFAVQALYGKYTDAVGKEGQLLTGKGSNQKEDSFRSQQELVQAMNDPRYDRDPAFRADIMRKLENSDIGTLTKTTL
jgi:hypothetical protein